MESERSRRKEREAARLSRLWTGSQQRVSLTYCVGQNITEPAHVQRQGTQISHLSGKNVKSFAVIFNPLQPETNPKGKYAYSTAG